MNEFDPFAADKKTKESTPGLGDAYDVALEALEHGLGLDHWKSTLTTERDHEVIIIDSEDDDDLGSDDQIRQAIELGIVSAPLRKTSRPPPPLALPFDNELSLPIRRQVQQPLRLLTPILSPPAKANLFNSTLRLPKRPSPPLPAYSDDELPYPLRKRKLRFSPGMLSKTKSYRSSSQVLQRTVSPTFALSDDEDLLLPPRRRRSGTANEMNPTNPKRNLPQRSTCKLSKATGSDLSANKLFIRNGLNASASAIPDDDIIGGDL